MMYLCKMKPILFFSQTLQRKQGVLNRYGVKRPTVDVR